VKESVVPKIYFRVARVLTLLYFVQIIAIGVIVPTKSYADGASEEAALFAKTLSHSCLKQWDQPKCLTNISQAALILAANYAGDLESQGMVGAVEQIKQNCAAATAGTKGNYPAYAMKSAFTECANMIYDVSEQTNINPDLSHYQLLVSSIMCLNKDRSCPTIEQGLQAYQ
jgi:hypothetical protein